MKWTYPEEDKYTKTNELGVVRPYKDEAILTKQQAKGWTTLSHMLRDMEQKDLFDGQEIIIRTSDDTMISKNAVRYKCPYCDTTYEEYRTNCKNCGGVVERI